MTDRVLIAGGGIGGLTAAIAARRAGFEAVVFERAPALEAAGAGITIQINAVLALRRLALDAAVIGAGETLRRAAIRDFRGRVLLDTPLDVLAREAGAPMIGMHRGRLQAELLAALGAEHVRTGFEVAGYEADDAGVTLVGASGARERGTLLVGADGLQSSVRAQLLADGPPRYAGYTSWRGVARDVEGVERDGTWESWGLGSRFGRVPIGAGETYWFATNDAPPGGRDAPGRAREGLLEIFRGWHAPVERLIEATREEDIVRTDICDRPPSTKWGEGRVTLLGDAAHPMTPNLGQGACQAIEDAVVLAECLARGGAGAVSLRAYEQRRMGRANWFVETSWRIGLIAQWRRPAAVWIRNTLVALTPRSRALAGMRQAVRFDPGMRS